MSIETEITRIKTNISNAYTKAKEKGAIMPTKEEIRLPEEYQEVEYIESTGTQYIDTGYIPQRTDNIYIEVYPIDYNPFFGAYNFVTARDNDDDYFRIFSTTGNLSGKLILNQWITGYYDSTAETFSMHGNTINAGNEKASNSIWLFGRHDTETKGKSRIKKFIVDNKLNLIPCYRKFDNIIGMYDLVNDVFYTNQGTGDFLKGDDFFPLVPDDKNSANLAKTIDTIIKPEGTLEVNFNDTYDVKEYANVKVNVDTGEEDWQPEPDWWDIDKILEEDTEDYPTKWIMLLDDNSPYTKFPYSYGSIMRASKIKMSDDTEYIDIKNEIVHYWDETKDKECSLGYKTRYAILYFKGTIEFGTIDFSNFRNCLYMYFKNATITTGNESYSFPNLTKIQALKFDNCIWGSTRLRFNRSSLRKIIFDNCDFSKILNLSNLFNGTTFLTNENINKIYNNIKTGDETNYEHAFYNCINLRNINLEVTNKVTSFSNAFNSCYNLSSKFDIDASSCINMNAAFSNCYKIPEIDIRNTTKITNFESAFNNCRSLKRINNNLLETLSCTNARNMLSSCASLITIGFSDTSKIKNMNSMFAYSYSLITINNLDLISATDVGVMFTNCYSLKNLTISNILINGLDFSTCLNLNHESLINIRNACYDYSGGTTHTIKIGTTNLAKLTEDEIAEWQNKNWTIS